MKSALYLKTSEDGIYHLLYSNELKLSLFKVICFYAELFGFISQALALIILLSAKLRSFAEIEVKSCLNLLLGELLKFFCPIYPCLTKVTLKQQPAG